MDHRQSVNITRVIDGDTVEIRTRPGLLRRSRKERIRLYGIDAPESAQKGGRNSTKHLAKLVGSGHKAWLHTSERDQYNRPIGLIYSRHGNPNYSYNYQMVEAGQAHCYLLSPQDKTRFQQAQAQAQARRLGLWRDPKPQPPWEWRRQHTKKPGTSLWKWVVLLLITIALAWLAAQFTGFPATIP